MKVMKLVPEKQIPLTKKWIIDVKGKRSAQLKYYECAIKILAKTDKDSGSKQKKYSETGYLNY